MLRRKVALAGLALAVMSGAPAVADGTHYAAPAADVPHYGGWTGFSVGVGVGAGMLSSEVNVDASRQDDIGLFVPDLGIEIPILGFLQTTNLDLEDAGDVGFLGTIQLAYDHQVSDRFVVGAFIDADLASDISSDFSTANAVDLQVLGGLINVPIASSSISGDIEQDWSFTAGGRIGWLTSPSTLFYVLAGYTHVELDNPTLNVQFANLFDALEPIGLGFLDIPNSLSVNLPDSLHGFTVGAGIETKITRAVSLKFEYRFTDLEAESATVSGTTFSPAIVDVISLRRALDNVDAELDSDIHTVRAVVSYKFGREEPVYEPLK